MRIAYSPDGKILAVAEQNNILLYKIEKGAFEKVSTLIGHTDKVNSITFSPDSILLVSGSADRSVCLWDIHTLKKTVTLGVHSGGVNSVAFSPDGLWLISGSADKTVCLWNTCALEKAPTLINHTGEVNSVAFSPDSLLFASGSTDNIIRLWKINTLKETITLAGHSSEVKAITFNPNGSSLASSSLDKTVRLWNTKTFKEMVILKGRTTHVNALAFTPNGVLLACNCADDTVRLWYTKPFKKAACPKELGNNTDGIAFSPDGQKLCSARMDNTLNLWNVSAYKETAPLRGEKGVSYKQSLTRFFSSAGIQNHPISNALPQEDVPKINEKQIKSVKKEYSKNELLSSLWRNRETYKRRLQDKLQAVYPQLPNYEILIKFKNVKPRDENYNLYASAAHLVDLNEDFQVVQKQLHAFLPAENFTGIKKLYLSQADRKIVFEEKVVQGGAWNIMYAAGFEEPEQGLCKLAEQLAEPQISDLLAQSLKKNFEANLSSEGLINTSFMEDETVLIATLTKLYDKTKKIHDTIQAHADARAEFLGYLLDKQVLEAYLTYAINAKYADPFILTACLLLQGKKLALLIDYDLKNGHLLDYSQNTTNFNDLSVVPIIYHPSQNSAFDYYCQASAKPLYHYPTSHEEDVDQATLKNNGKSFQLNSKGSLS